MADSDDAEREPSQPGGVLESPAEAQDERDPDTDPFRAVDPGPHGTGPFAGPTTGSFVIPEPEPTGDTFDAFNTDTWRFRQPPPPWYRTKDARLLLIVVAVAVIALVVSLVVLATRRDAGSNEPSPVESTPTTTTTTTTTTVTSPPAPPPPSSTEPPPAAAPPAYYPPAAPPAPTRPPEINVTRMPMSVAPQPRHR
ncbi:hypothetical protein EB75_15960 [Mycobacterium sp. ST-F2]|uniref:hypothetical protein n=1 Tax=Mycobacterium sp. ST-F2 TaxID=1490484 RepID=UPI00093B038E|nr:hypothetical protein [Mycobacterium sp. ST-F2]OKH85787.1 hypothetical protein EB75_15960 [Mycobacterium sp. ST-F2]